MKGQPNAIIPQYVCVPVPSCKKAHIVTFLGVSVNRAVKRSVQWSSRHD